LHLRFNICTNYDFQQINLHVYIFIHKQERLETIHSGTPLNSPSHVFPFPRYPLLHVHVYEPGVFVQRALASQGGVPEVHSFMSVCHKVIFVFTNIMK